VVDVSLVPFIPMLTRKTVITDTQTNRKAEGFDWSSFRESERKAWQKLSTGQATRA
jgi:hypothetical protein